MTLLSRKIEELIIESGETVQSLSEMGKINRTTLQRVKSGERLPSKKLFENLCKVLRLSPSEKEELAVLLEIATIGERHYYNRQMIIELIEMISELTEYKIPFTKEVYLKEGNHSIFENSEKIQIFKGKTNVSRIIENCIDREMFLSQSSIIKLAIPYDFESVYHYIFLQMMGCQKNLVLQDVINLPKDCNVKEADRSLVALKYLIAISLLDNVEYQSHYYYQLPEENTEFSALFPYFILTSENVITLSKDLKVAVFYQDPEFLKTYENGYIKMLENSEPYILESNDVYQLYGLEESLKSKHVVEPLPCFACYFTDELIKRKMNPNFPFYEELLGVALTFYEKFRNENQNMINVFSLKNLKNFMTDGSLYLPAELCNPFNPEERLNLVKQLRDDLVNNQRKIYALNDDKIFLNSSIEFTNDYTLIRLILHYKIDQKMVYKTITLTEEKIINAFDDFFESLPGSDYVLQPEQTIAEIEGIINQYENQ